MAKYKNWLLYVIALFTQISAGAQDAVANTKVADDGFMRSEGKIYVVMAVVITILTGLILYVVRLDRKITKLEKSSQF